MFFCGEDKKVEFLLSQYPAEHQEQSEAGDTQATEHQRVPKIDPQARPKPIPQRGEHRQGAQSRAGAPQQAQSAADGLSQEDEEQKKPQSPRDRHDPIHYATGRAAL